MLLVNTDSKIYPVYFENSFDNLPNALKRANLHNRKICIVTDDNVEKIYLLHIEHLLKIHYDEVYAFVFKHGEENKILSTIESMYKQFLNMKLDRGSVIISLGGGICGDMAGFAAATYMRGIAFVQIPTTLLSQVDSSVGGKTGVDFYGNKNIIGTFYQPELVYINTNTLKTLDKREFNSGMAEVIKYGLIYDINYYKYILENKEAIKQQNIETLLYLVTRSCEIKAEIVSEDERELGKREILNFGHTFGHAIESTCNFSILHGEAVALGFIAALHLSKLNGYISTKEILQLKSMLEFFELLVIPKNVDTEMIFERMFFDKKNKNNKITLILLKELGEAFSSNEIGRSDILKAINCILKDDNI